MFTLGAIILASIATYGVGVGGTYGYLMKRRKWADNECCHGSFCEIGHVNAAHDGPATGTAGIIAATWPIGAVVAPVGYLLGKVVYWIGYMPAKKAYDLCARERPPALPEARVIKE